MDVARGRRLLSRGLDRAMRLRGASQAALARESGVARSHLRGVLAGARSCGVWPLARLAWALELPPAWLVDETCREESDVGPPPTCMPRSLHLEHPVRLPSVIASNVRVLAGKKFGGVRPVQLATHLGWHPSAVYALLGGRRALCIDRLMTLASGLAVTPAELLRVPDRARASSETG